MTAPDSLGPFEVLGRLGAGGMGEVFRARDPRLGREVAVKVLPPELTDDPERRTRFLREARAAAKLNHPNITTIHEVGRADGRDFIAFELVEGRTLAEVVPERRLSLEELLDLAIPIADALAFAHERGVIHRDLKLANVMVDSRGQPKLLDFGLAKVRDDEAADTSLGDGGLTLTGQVFGTPNAMSPEQAAGKPVDERSDVFSFGALLYEMGARRAPFLRDTVMETVSAVIHERPPDLRSLRKDLPAGFARVVERALEKDPASRYPSMAALAADLRALRPRPRASLAARAVPAAAVVLVALLAARFLVGGGAPDPAGPDRHAIAVLPFSSVSGSPEDEAFAAGMYGDVQTQISKIGDLRVIAPSSVTAALERHEAPADVARELGVASLLEGSVQRAGDQVRIQLALVGTETGETLWREAYTRRFTVEDVFVIQSEIAGQVAQQLDARLTQQEAGRIAELPTNSTEAYEAYLLAKQANIFTPEGLAEVQARLGRAIELDPEFTEAYAFYGAMLLLSTWLDEMDPELRERGRGYVERAIELDPSDPTAQMSLGMLAYQDRDYARALEVLEQVRAVQPSNSICLTLLAALHRRRGDFYLALEAYEGAVRLDPLDVQTRDEYGRTLTMLGRSAEADEQYQKALELEPTFSGAAYARLRNRLRGTLDQAAARAAVRQFLEAGWGDDSDDVWELGLLVRDLDLALEGVRELPERQLTQARDHVGGNPRGLVHALRGEEELARAAFREALSVLGEDETDDPRTLAARALAAGGLGDGEEALRLGEAALAAMPWEQDHIVRPLLQLDVATALELAGERDRAVELLIELTRRPSYDTFASLARDARFASLAEHPAWREAATRAAD